MVDEFQTELFVEMQDGFTVAVRAETVAFGFQMAAQFDEIVNLAIGHQRQGAVFVAERLRAGLQVNDAEAAHRQEEMRGAEFARAVRPAMAQAFIDRSDPVHVLGCQR